jgi:hypothetical protein
MQASLSVKEVYDILVGWALLASYDHHWAYHIFRHACEKACFETTSVGNPAFTCWRGIKRLLNSELQPDQSKTAGARTSWSRALPFAEVKGGEVHKERGKVHQGREKIEGRKTPGGPNTSGC